MQASDFDVGKPKLLDHPSTLYELAFRTRLTLVACQRPAIAAMFSAFSLSAMVL
jgi:hypothetical protein